MAPMVKKSCAACAEARRGPAAPHVLRCRLTDLDQLEIDAAALLYDALLRHGEPATMAECLALVREGEGASCRACRT